MEFNLTCPSGAQTLSSGSPIRVHPAWWSGLSPASVSIILNQVQAQLNVARPAPRGLCSVLPSPALPSLEMVPPAPEGQVTWQLHVPSACSSLSSLPRRSSQTRCMFLSTSQTASRKPTPARVLWSVSKSHLLHKGVVSPCLSSKPLKGSVWCPILSLRWARCACSERHFCHVTPGASLPGSDADATTCWLCDLRQVP